MREHAVLQGELAALIEKLDKHVERHGGCRNYALVKRNLEEAALWLLTEEAAMAGTSIVDGLRGR